MQYKLKDKNASTEQDVTGIQKTIFANTTSRSNQYLVMS